MTDKERLIELLHKAEDICDSTTDCDTCKYVLSGSCRKVLIADYLLANGVFILPEDLRGTEDFSISAFIEAMQMYKEKDRYIKPPCKVGQKFYWINFVSKEIETDIVVAIHQYENGFKITTNTIGSGTTCTFSLDKFLRIMFLTKEEAEEKLKELSK